MKYFQPFGITDTDASYINGDPTVGRQGSIVPAGAIESPQREIINVLEAAQLEPQESDLNQLLQAVRSQRMNYAIAEVSADPNIVKVSFDPPIADTMTPGMPLRIKASAANTAACSLIVDDIETPLRRADGAELEADDIKAAETFEVVWNDTFWAMTNYRGLGGEGPPTTNNYITKIPYAVDTGSVNELAASFSPAITSLAAGDAIEVKLANNITGAATIAVNAISAKAIVRPDGTPLQDGDAVAGQIMLLIYSDANNFQFDGIIPQEFTGVGVPVGALILTLGNAAPLNTIKANGALLNRAEHPRLWTFANASGRIVNEADWQNAPARLWTSFSRGDGSATFRVPDLRGEFMRFWDDGRGIDANRLLTYQQKDQVGEALFQGAVSITNLNKFIVTYPGLAGGYPSSQLGSGNVADPYFPGFNEFSGDMSFTANTGVETRVRNAAIMPCIVDG